MVDFSLQNQTSTDDEFAERISFSEIPSQLVRSMFGIERFVSRSGLEERMLHLVLVRASMVNGCAYCIDMHSKESVAAGESLQRLAGLAAWREAPFYSPKERAALAWAECLTRVAESGVSDEDYQAVRAEFDVAELCSLTAAINNVNDWNRIAVAFRFKAGSYEVGSVSALLG